MNSLAIWSDDRCLLQNKGQRNGSFIPETVCVFGTLSQPYNQILENIHTEVKNPRLNPIQFPFYCAFHPRNHKIPGKPREKGRGLNIVSDNHLSASLIKLAFIPHPDCSRRCWRAASWTPAVLLVKLLPVLLGLIMFFVLGCRVIQRGNRPNRLTPNNIPSKPILSYPWACPIVS